jgi:sterol desaturase/sphingolipid hydroxylase (fatty acid hydroxylase superfamily)
MLYETHGLLAELERATAEASLAVEFTGELAAFMLLLCFAGFANLEKRIPKIRRPASHTRQSYRTNIGLFVFNSVLMSLCSVSTLFLVATHYSGYGLLNYISHPVIKAGLAFVAMDLLLYGWHRVCHHFDALWLLHRVHHNDPHMNVSTAFRLHFVEVLATNSLKALLIIALGIDASLVLAIETVVTFSIMFHHANISFTYEKLLSRLFIVPFLHRTHHSTERSEHDSNYGAILSVWDRLFGTAAYIEPKGLGIKGASPQHVFGLVKFGFGIETPLTLPAMPELEAMIAEAAYYRAEKRNFHSGYEMRDWLEAKNEILEQINLANKPKATQPVSIICRLRTWCANLNQNLNQQLS